MTSMRDTVITNLTEASNIEYSDKSDLLNIYNVITEHDKYIRMNISRELYMKLELELYTIFNEYEWGGNCETYPKLVYNDGVKAVKEVIAYL